MAAAELLALVEAVIAKRLRADAMESYSRAEQEFRGTPLPQLMQVRDQLRQEAAAESGGCFQLAEPFEE